MNEDPNTEDTAIVIDSDAANNFWGITGLIIMAVFFIAFLLTNKFVIDHAGYIILGALLCLPFVIYAVIRNRQHNKLFEYDEFVWKWPEAYRSFEIIGAAKTDSLARKYFWQQLEGEILPEIQKWKDEGWDTYGIFPLIKIGTANFRINKIVYRKGLITSKTRFEPREFRLKLRRPKAISNYVERG